MNPDRAWRELYEVYLQARSIAYRSDENVVPDHKDTLEVLGRMVEMLEEVGDFAASDFNWSTPARPHDAPGSEI